MTHESRRLGVGLNSQGQGANSTMNTDKKTGRANH